MNEIYENQVFVFLGMQKNDIKVLKIIYDKDGKLKLTENISEF